METVFMVRPLLPPPQAPCRLAALTMWTNCVVRSGLPPRREFETINKPEHEQRRSPPHTGVQVEEDHAGIGWRIYQLVNSRSEYQRAIHGQRNANEKPDGNHAACLHLPKKRLPENNVQYEENDNHHRRPEKRLLIKRDVPDGRN